MKLNLSNLYKHYSSYALWAIGALEILKVQAPDAYAMLPHNLVIWVTALGLVLRTIPQGSKR